jgi:hypothetical protein
MSGKTRLFVVLNAPRLRNWETVPTPLPNVNDVVFVERRHDVRIVARVPGTVLFANKYDDRGERRVFNCRAVNISTSAIAVVCATEVDVGERAILRLEQFGEFRGVVMRLLNGGFVLGVELSDAQRDALVVKIDGFEKIKNHDAPNRRGDIRFVPKDPQSRLIWANGITESCLIMDLSTSGAAVSAETVPEIGTVVALGSVIGRVVRIVPGGFAMQFIEKQSSDLVELLATQNN